MFASEEGVLGTLIAKNEENLPISITINYTKTNEMPYAFLAIGDVTVGNDFYFIYGNRKNENDELSNQKIEEENEQSSDDSNLTVVEDYNQIVINNENDEMETNSFEDELDINTLSESSSAYDTVFQGTTMSGYTYKNSFYPLVATSLYSPSKQKSNCTYCLRAKVNEQMADADNYITQVCHQYGAVLVHDACAKIELYTKNKNVQLSELDPETTNFLTFSASVSGSIFKCGD